MSHVALASVISKSAGPKTKSASHCQAKLSNQEKARAARGAGMTVPSRSPAKAPAARLPKMKIRPSDRQPTPATVAMFDCQHPVDWSVSISAFMSRRRTVSLHHRMVIYFHSLHSDNGRFVKFVLTLLVRVLPVFGWLRALVRPQWSEGWIAMPNAPTLLLIKDHLQPLQMTTTVTKATLVLCSTSTSLCAQ